MTLTEFNALDPHDAAQALELCCVSTHWIEGVLSGRPYSDTESLRLAADKVWASLTREDYLEAFDANRSL